MRRRVKLPATSSKSKSGPVIVRSLSNPWDGWTLEEALGLVAQGYTPRHVEQLTGWNAKQLEAQLARRRRPGAA